MTRLPLPPISANVKLKALGALAEALLKLATKPKPTATRPSNRTAPCNCSGKRR